MGLATCLLLGGCAGGGLPARMTAAMDAAEAPRAVDWRKVATATDRSRLRGWRTAWMAALSAVRADGKGAVIAADPALYDPDRSLPDPVPPAGTYRCRTIKLGGQGPYGLTHVAYGWFACRVSEEGAIDRLEKMTGSQRMAGSLFEDTDARSVFLGTLALGDERGGLAYGRDTQRDMAGFVERIGEKRWRLVLPYPHYESTLDLLEIVAGP
ncbi:hypothetical protein ASE75_00745 [Sphingomonas sp. Leaf17]|nr:hypothetical protein ASE75_00745 [Sphingomonas sp. Leaf17]